MGFLQWLIFGEFGTSIMLASSYFAGTIAGAEAQAKRPVPRSIIYAAVIVCVLGGPFTLVFAIREVTR